MPEQYEGVKFKTVFAGPSVSKAPTRQLKEMVGWCRRFSDMMLVAAEAGNLSFRLGSGFVITPTGKSKTALLPADLVEVVNCDIEKGEVAVRGAFEPSSESMLHWLVYKSRSDVNAVFHLHDFDVLEKRDELRLKSTAKAMPYGTLGLAIEVLSALGKNENYILIMNHGTLSVGGSMDAAGELALDVHQRALE